MERVNKNLGQPTPQNKSIIIPFLPFFPERIRSIIDHLRYLHTQADVLSTNTNTSAVSWTTYRQPLCPPNTLFTDPKQERWPCSLHSLYRFSSGYEALTCVQPIQRMISGMDRPATVGLNTSSSTRERRSRPHFQHLNCPGYEQFTGTEHCHTWRQPVSCSNCPRADKGCLHSQFFFYDHRNGMCQVPQNLISWPFRNIMRDYPVSCNISTYALLVFF